MGLTNRFKNRWMLKTDLDLGNGVKARVSTVDLVVEHPWGDKWGYYYETAIFLDVDNPDLELEADTIIAARYRTRREAEEGHWRFVEALKKGRILRFEKVCRTLVKIDYDEVERVEKGEAV